MTRDWMSATHIDDLAQEAKTARDRPLRQHWEHAIDCRCRDCIYSEVDPEDGHGC